MLLRGILNFSFVTRLVAVLTIALLVMPAPALALDIEEIQQRLEERRAERRERLNALQTTPTPVVETPVVTPTETPSAQDCGCTAGISFAKPDVQWKSGVLEFVPRFNIDIRIRGEEGASPWQTTLAYDGTAYTTSFSGNHTFGGQCFDGRYKYTGIAGNPVTIQNLVRSMFGADDELQTAITMRGQITGCDEDAELRQTKVRIEELGNLKISGWRSWRP